MTPEALDRAWPVLDALPFPVTRIGSDYRVLASNRAAVEAYGSAPGMCFQVSHGHNSPCDDYGELCPKLTAENTGEPLSVLHVHQLSQGVERYKITALPILGGGILELHIPLHDVTTMDGLTGLTNRTEGEQLIRRAAALMGRMRLGYALVMLDLDYFKRINDTFGHQVGDRVLSAFAEILHNTVRKADIAVRWGGEEFLVVLLAEDLAAAEQFTHRLLEKTRALNLPIEGNVVRVTVSAGIRYVRPDEVQSLGLDQAVKDADDALYHTKQTGRDRLHVHSS
jgi:diguanylate cyclase (GGDEF)-like protein